MAGWHHRLDGHEFVRTPGAGDGQGGLECCKSWGRKELDMTEQLHFIFSLSCIREGNGRINISFKYLKFKYKFK